MSFFILRSSWLKTVKAPLPPKKNPAENCLTGSGHKYMIHWFVPPPPPLCRCQHTLLDLSIKRALCALVSYTKHWCVCYSFIRMMKKCRDYGSLGHGDSFFTVFSLFANMQVDQRWKQWSASMMYQAHKPTLSPEREMSHLQPQLSSLTLLFLYSKFPTWCFPIPAFTPAPDPHLQWLSHYKDLIQNGGISRLSATIIEDISLGINSVSHFCYGNQASCTEKYQLWGAGLYYDSLTTPYFKHFSYSRWMILKFQQQCLRKDCEVSPSWQLSMLFLASLWIS